MVSATDSVTGEAARKNLAGARVKMKKLYDRHSQCCQFTKGDQVMALLPVEATPFQAFQAFQVCRTLHHYKTSLRAELPDCNAKSEEVLAIVLC